MNNWLCKKAAALLGRKSYEVRVERLGIEHIRKTARENGALGGRPNSDPAVEPTSADLHRTTSRPSRQR